MNTIITEKIDSLLSIIESERAKYAADFATALRCGDNNGIVNGDMEESLENIGKSLTEIREMIRPAAALADAARGTLSMSDMKHPDGYYTLGETGHFQQLKSALDEFDGQNEPSPDAGVTEKRKTP